MSVSGTVLGTAALLLGFYQAPFSHIHLEDFDHPASATLIHWHLHYQAPSAPTPLISALTADDDAIDVGWNALRCSFTGIPFDFNIAETIQPPAVAQTSTPVPAPYRRGHDPPEKAAPKSPRAPPA